MIQKILPLLQPEVAAELTSALSEQLTNLPNSIIQSKSYIIVVCGFQASPDLNQLHLRNSKTVISLNPGINLLTVEEYPELKYGFLPLNISYSIAPNQNCQSILEIDLSHFDASEVESTELMFGDMFALKKVNLSNVKFSNVRTMDSMFSRCLSLQDLVINDVRTFKSDHLVSANGMFYMCDSIKQLGLSYLGGSQLKSMIGICDGMGSLEDLDISGCNLRGIKLNDNVGRYLFEGCKSLKKVYMFGCNDLSVKKIRQELNESGNANAVIKRVVIAGAK